MKIATKIAVWAASSARFSCRPPICCAMTTLTPMDSPKRSSTMRLMAGMSFPTAAIASLPTNCPKIRTSAELNSCSATPVKAMGSEKRSSLPPMAPCSISITALPPTPTIVFSLQLILHPKTTPVQSTIDVVDSRILPLYNQDAVHSY